ncbi:nicotinate-nucleotide-dimethylbenzimidazole phosphoribosyltransferase [Peptostreptococcus russellii]|uniref:Nicotinate-nucleotide--dimethylbenzimidazole phosphoribosyltransferase n=1 Tax=Peptostreptococcus russellii TaxID=215200 RepID=A0A1H8GZI5_9FIRM|nr:nicotinate-nucleotide--dimethylbenzimidazole phosphoribosyltransferase [Peptostreptococcus russellii]SEN48648.1 nicotinate-nucleotide-dimethylbenzimidazole phosphoribosyltransferase [Peptostreptococcus russellii]
MNLLVSISRNIYSLDKKSIDKCRKRWDNLIHPKGTLGKLEDITAMLSGVYGSHKIDDRPKKCIIAFAADHGVYEEGVSPQTQDITRMQFENFTNGKCAVATLAAFNNINIIPVDIGMMGTEAIYGVLDYKIRQGTSNMAIGPAMTANEAVKAIEIGIEVAERCIVDGYKIIGVGEMGISNTTPATAIISVMTGKDPKEVTDMGAGLKDELIKHKADIIRKSIEINNPNPTDGIEVLSKVGGFEIGGITGVILGCAANRTPVVIDGYISYAAALIAYRINPKSIDYVIPSHFSKEKGSQAALDMLKLEPMLNLDMRLGEGTGAALMMNIIDSAIYAYNNMGKFEEEEIGKFMGPGIDS